MDLMKHLPETCKELQSKLDESNLRLAEFREDADKTRAATQEAAMLRETLDNATEKLEARTTEVGYIYVTAVGGGLHICHT
jgi:uncharacterized coiled-coil DUF342 family protein